MYQPSISTVSAGLQAPASGCLMVVVGDCGGSYSEEGHNAALKGIGRFGDLVDSSELIDLWWK